jgi:hypothetical protein
LEIGEKSEQSRQLGIQSCHARMDDRLTGKEKTAITRKNRMFRKNVGKTVRERESRGKKVEPTKVE